MDDINKLPAVVKAKLPSEILVLPSPVSIQWAQMSTDAQSTLWQAFNDSIMPAYAEHKLGMLTTAACKRTIANNSQALCCFNSHRISNQLLPRANGSNIVSVNCCQGP